MVVFVFFVVFGAVAMRPEVVQAWLGHEPSFVIDQLNLTL